MVENKVKKPYIPYAPGYDYDWVKEVNSDDFIPHPLYSQDPKVARADKPVKLSKLKIIVADALSRPEIIEAYTAYLREMTDEEYAVFFNTKLFFGEYLKFKYGNVENYKLIAPEIITKIASNKWAGFEDPELQGYLEGRVERGRLIKDVEY